MSNPHGLDEQTAVQCQPQPDCPDCFGTGLVMDYAEFQGATMAMPSECECLGRETAGNGEL